MKYLRTSNGSLYLITNVEKITETKGNITFYTVSIGRNLSLSFFNAEERNRCIEEIEAFILGEEKIIDESDIYDSSLSECENCQ